VFLSSYRFTVVKFLFLVLTFLLFNFLGFRILNSFVEAGVDADFLDGLDSTQFLRSDTSDTFTAGTLTLDSGTTLSISGSLVLPSSGIIGAGSGSGLNADLLDGQSSNYFLDLDNQTGTCTNCLTGIEIDESSLNHGLLSGLVTDNHPQYLLANGTRSLSSDWDAGDFKILAKQLDLGSGSNPETLYLSAEAPKILATSTDNASGLRIDLTGTSTQLLQLQYNGTTVFSFSTSGVSQLGTIENSTFDISDNLFKAPAFRVVKTATSGPYNNLTQTVGTTLEEYDYGDNFEGSDIPPSYQFRAPISGVYHFDGSAMLTSLLDSSTNNYVFLTLNDITKAIGNRISYSNVPNTLILQISTDLLLSAGDTVRLRVFSSDSSYNIAGDTSGIYSYFSGRLVVRDN